MNVTCKCTVGSDEDEFDNNTLQLLLMLLLSLDTF